MIVTITNLKTCKVTKLDVPDEKCDQLLDKFAYEFNLPDPEADARWERMMQARAMREAQARQSNNKERKRR